MALTALLLPDSVIKEYSYTTGTGTYALAGAWGGQLRFSAFFVTGAAVTYEVTDASANSEWVTGIYDAGANTLTRGTIIASTNSDQPIDWSGRTRLIITPLCACGAG